MIKLPSLGDATKEKMPAEVVQFLEKLGPQLKRDGKRALEDAEGKWPDYPRAIVDLARKYKLAVPGWTLPGPPAYWDRLRAGRMKK